MDEQRFDQFTRAMAGRDSRRRLLRGLAGIVGLAAVGSRAGTTAARHGVAGPGDPCRTSEQCVAADAPMVCADNGFDYDGPLNCCTYVGSRCGFDEACCGSAICAGGYCAIERTFSGPGDLGPGDPCQDSSQCGNAFPELGILYCADNGDAGDGPLNCCRYEGGTCGGPLSDFDAACCGDLRCLGGVCGWG